VSFSTAHFQQREVRSHCCPDPRAYGWGFPWLGFPGQWPLAWRRVRRDAEGVGEGEGTPLTFVLLSPAFAFAFAYARLFTKIERKKERRREQSFGGREGSLCVFVKVSEQTGSYRQVFLLLSSPGTHFGVLPFRRLRSSGFLMRRVRWEGATKLPCSIK
jgi:hypothetical protein